MMTDPIADMLTRIRNAVRVERPLVEIPVSKVKRGVAEVLKREGYIWDWEEVNDKPSNQLRVHLKYGPNGERVIRRIRRLPRV
jgi:small subunit ribosomal protein S8